MLCSIARQKASARNCMNMSNQIVQGILKELLTSGAVHLLPEELQWRIRQLMPHVAIAPKPKVHAPTPSPLPLITESGVASSGLLAQPVPNLALLASLLPQVLGCCWAYTLHLSNSFD